MPCAVGEPVRPDFIFNGNQGIGLCAGNEMMDRAFEIQWGQPHNDAIEPPVPNHLAG
jgi:hypothetical protein